LPRFAKNKSMGIQAKAILNKYLDLTSRHEVKKQQSLKGSQSTGKIHSIRTFDKYYESLKKAGEWIQNHHPLHYLDQVTIEQATQYLVMRRIIGISQKQLDSDRNALQFVIKEQKIERVMSLVKPSKSSKRYTKEQIIKIIGCQTRENSIATLIAYEAGLRAHELFTIRRLNEDKSSLHRKWNRERFKGRSEGVKYIVTGKGGLKREVLFSKEAANLLEAQRLSEQKKIKDRGVYYQQYYDISGGNKWSKSFGDASKRELGWSKGAHGLRHTYVQERMRELQNLGKEYKEARNIVSQELGHFRGDVIETYLR